MSENSLKCRNKFVNKVVDKLNGLKNDIELLYKVDKKISRKIFKNINNQSGGTGDEVIIKANQAQIELLKKEAELQEKTNAYISDQQEKLNRHMQAMQDIHNQANNSAEQLVKLERLVSSFQNIIINMIDAIKDMDIRKDDLVLNPLSDDNSENTQNTINMNKILNTTTVAWDKAQTKRAMILIAAREPWDEIGDEGKKLFNNIESNYTAYL